MTVSSHDGRHPWLSCLVSWDSHPDWHQSSAPISTRRCGGGGVQAPAQARPWKAAEDHRTRSARAWPALGSGCTPRASKDTLQYCSLGHEARSGHTPRYLSGSGEVHDLAHALVSLVPTHSSTSHARVTPVRCLAHFPPVDCTLCVWVKIWADLQAMPEQQVPVRRRARLSKLKTVAGTLLDLQNDITDPITQVPSVNTAPSMPSHSAEDLSAHVPGSPQFADRCAVRSTSLGDQRYHNAPH